jgi:hypothetical protein
VGSAVERGVSILPPQHGDPVRLEGACQEEDAKASKYKIHVVEGERKSELS